MYGFITQGTAMKTTILANAYPEMLKNPSVMNTSFYYAKNLSTKILIVGSIKVAFIALLETLISARVADNLTDTRFDQN
jgi:MFS superfamily sulfate permease-like transporter